jgi:dihydrofolate reductase
LPRLTTEQHHKSNQDHELTTTTQVSVDGVMQGPGANSVEGEGGVFKRRGWAHFDNEAGTVMDEIFQRANAFLFGRRTYEHFADTWGTWDDPGDSPIWKALNTKSKYVASTTLTGPQWTKTTVLSSDVAAAVRELKAKPGRELKVHGSGVLFRLLLDNNLVDEINLSTFPVVVGEGTRLFAATGPDIALDMVDSRATSSGLTDPGLPAHRAPAVRNVDGPRRSRAIPLGSRGEARRADEPAVSTPLSSSTRQRPFLERSPAKLVDLSADCVWRAPRSSARRQRLGRVPRLLARVRVRAGKTRAAGPICLPLVERLQRRGASRHW